MFFLFRFKQQEAPVPASASKAAHKLHSTVSRQDLSYLLSHVPFDGERMEMVKVIPAQLPQAPSSCTVALPRLGFKE